MSGSSAMLVTVRTVTAAALLVSGALLLGPAAPLAQGNTGGPEAATPNRPWAASATGRVEPRAGTISITTQQPGRVVDVAVITNDAVKAGDLLVRLDEEDLLTKVAAATAEVQVREREREEERATGLALERRQAEDAVASAERALYRARLTFDELSFRARTSGGIPPGDVEQARGQIATAKEQLNYARSSLLRVQGKAGMPLATRLESSLASARMDLALAESAVEKARIRAPVDGTVLGVYIKYGELATPSVENPLVLMGDLTSLRVRAEVEERDAPRVKVGQKAVVRGDAFPDKEFEGTVTSVSKSMAAPRIPPRGVRRPTDVEVVEVLVALQGQPPLLSGMRVDVFFRQDQATAPTGASSGPASMPSAIPGTGARASAN